MTGTPDKPMRIGEMLIAVGLLSEDDLNDAAQLAVDLGLPLGKVLVMSGFLTDGQLQAAVQVQSMVKDQILGTEIAAQALKLVASRCLPLEQALREVGWVQRDVMPKNKLGDLLVESGIIVQETLVEALQSSSESGLPLGRILVLTGKLPEALIYACLNAQVLLRDGKISREQAIQGLKAAHRRQMSIEQALIEQGLLRPPSHAKIKLGELFVLSGILTEEDIMNALETGLITEEPLGQVLVKSGQVPRTLLDTALRLQEMVDNGTLGPLNSAEVLRQIYTRGISIAQAVAELGLLKQESHETIRLGELLKLAGFITEVDIQDALRLSLKNNALVGKILLIGGAIDETTLHAALRCQFLLREGFLKEEQAIIALHYCQRMHCSMDEAMVELGWTVPTRTVIEGEAATK